MTLDKPCAAGRNGDGFGFRAKHRAVWVLLQIVVGRVSRAGALNFAAPGCRGMATHSCSGILTGR